MTDRQIAFLSYHKTGWELTNILMNAIRHPLSLHGHNFDRSGGSHWRTCLCDDLTCAGEKRRAHKWHAVDLAPRPTPLPACFVVVHMVRDPARWALSWYDFHRQQPPPEGWIHSHAPNCTTIVSHDESARLVGVGGDLLEAAMLACATLVDPSHSYYAHLRAYDEDERAGLRSMALLHLLDTQLRGDLLRAAANAVTLRRTLGPERVLTVWMDQIVAEPEASFGRLATFLVGVDVPAVAQSAAVASALLEAQAAAFGSKACSSSHVTSSHSSANRKAELTATLETDAVLAPIYALWRDAFDGEAPMPLSLSPSPSDSAAASSAAVRCPAAPPSPPFPPDPSDPPRPPTPPPSWAATSVPDELVLHAAFPLHVAASGRHLVGDDGTPFYYSADTQWPLLWAYDLEEAAALLDVRLQAGFTAIQLSLIPFSNVPNTAGERVFLNASTFEPNEAYFDHADRVLDALSARGMAAYLVPLWANQVESDSGAYHVKAAAPECDAFGRWLAGRWRGRANLMWAVGGDIGLGDRGDEGHEQLVVFRALAEGLRAGGATQLLTFHPTGGRIPSVGFSSANFLLNESWVDFDSVQVHGSCRQVTSRSIESFRRQRRPSLVAEGWYFAEEQCMAFCAPPPPPDVACRGHKFCVHTTTPLGIRRATWSARVGGGSLGDAYAEWPFWAHKPTAEAGLSFSSPAAAWQVATVMRRILDMACWHHLVPDDPFEWAPLERGRSDGYVSVAASAANDTLLLYWPAAAATRAGSSDATLTQLELLVALFAAVVVGMACGVARLLRARAARRQPPRRSQWHARRRRRVDRHQQLAELAELDSSPDEGPRVAVPKCSATRAPRSSSGSSVVIVDDEGVIDL